MTPRNYHNTHPSPKDRPMKRDLCGAIKPNKLPCNNPAGYGTDHQGMGPCKHHFGNTAKVVRGAAIEEGKDVAVMLKGMGVAVDMDPGEALRWEVNNTLGHIAWHRAVIETWNLLNEDGSANPLTPEQTEFYERYLAERQHLVRGARMAIAADIEGRAQRLAEAQADMVADAIDQLLVALRLTAAQRDRVPDILPVILRTLDVQSRPLELEGVFSTDDDLNIAITKSREQS